MTVRDQSVTFMHGALRESLSSLWPISKSASNSVTVTNL